MLAGGGLRMRHRSSLLIWGGALRTVFVWHTTWSVNSLSHIWGYRNYPTSDASRNNALVALVAFGEGWHNNHHANSRSARHGHKWWEFDPTWLAIRSLMLLGLAKNVALPSPVLAAKSSPSELWRSSSEQSSESVAQVSIQSQGDRIEATSANGIIE